MTHQRKPRTNEPSDPRGLVERPTGPVVRITAYVPAELARATKIRAATLGRTLSDVVMEALDAQTQRLQRKEKRP